MRSWGTAHAVSGSATGTNAPPQLPAIGVTPRHSLSHRRWERAGVRVLSDPLQSPREQSRTLPQEQRPCRPAASTDHDRVRNSPVGPPTWPPVEPPEVAPSTSCWPIRTRLLLRLGEARRRGRRWHPRDERCSGTGSGQAGPARRKVPPTLSACSHTKPGTRAARSFAPPHPPTPGSDRVFSGSASRPRRTSRPLRGAGDPRG